MKMVSTGDVGLADIEENNNPERADVELENDIINEMQGSPLDHTYILYISQITGASKLGAKEPVMFKGDAKLELPSLYDRLFSYGDGDYRIKVNRDGRFWKKFDISIKLPPQEKKIEPVTQPKSDLAGVIEAMQRSNEQLLARVFERLPQANAAVAAPAIDPLTMFEKFSAIMANMRPPAAPDTGSVYMNALTQAVTLMKSVMPSEKETGVYDLLLEGFRSIGPALPAIISQATQQVPQNRNVQLPPQAPPQTNGSIQPPMPANDNSGVSPEIIAQLNANPQVTTVLKNAIDTLMNYARASADPAKAAEWVSQNWSPAFIQQMLGRPDWFQIICYLQPQAKPFDVWFEKLIAEIELVMNSEEDGDDLENDAGDLSPAIPHGTA